jgi:hypothetical protein
MINSKQLAQIIGPTLSVMTFSEMINLSIWETNIPTVIYLNGVLLFLGGIAISRVHNFWVRSWTIIITLVGWFSILIGLFRMFFPTATQAAKNFSTYVMLIILCVVGLFLTLKGYYPTEKSANTL